MVTDRKVYKWEIIDDFEANNMNNEEFERHFGFNPIGVNGVIEDGFFGKTVYKNTSNFLKSFGLRMLLCGLVGVLGAGAINNSQKVGQLDQHPVASHIDRDGLADLSIGNRVYLADQTDEGVVYRLLRSSDVYRVTS